MIGHSPNIRISRTGIVIVIGLGLLFAACQSAAVKPEFDGNKAFDLLHRQVDMGPRNPGSQGWQTFQSFMIRYLDSLGLTYEKQPFNYYDYLTGDTLHLVNWIIKINPDASKRVLLGAHYDSRPRADYDPDTTRRNEPIVGANDGASGTAVLLYLADIMHSQPPPMGVDIVLFDGEDYGPPGRDDQYLLGSTYFASNHSSEYEYGMLLDMIGDKDLQIYRERLSEEYVKDVNDRVWNAATRLGVAQFIDSLKHNVLDDHIPLIGAGIPIVDLIDFDYPYWHTHADTPDKCDAASLAAVGRVVLEVIYGQ